MKLNCLWYQANKINSKNFHHFLDENEKFMVIINVNNNNNAYLGKMKRLMFNEKKAAKVFSAKTNFKI